MAQYRKQLGDFGERAAAAYLKHQGYVVVGCKWRCAAGEIDLLARDSETLVFVEVRTRRRGPYGAAVESIGRAKQARLIALAYHYLAKSGIPALTPWRIDVVAIELDRSGQIMQLEHIPNAVEER